MTAYKPNEKWLIDLSDMSNYSAKKHGYKWLLLCIDFFTRKLTCEKLKNKEGETVLNAFKNIVSRWGKPNVLISDNGTEFVNNNFVNFLNQNNITQQTAAPGYHKTLGIIDRVTRTIKEKVNKLWTDQDTTNWVDHIDDIINSYKRSKDTKEIKEFWYR
jgi:transposase InsO family protein